MVQNITTAKSMFNFPIECVFLHRAVQRRCVRPVQPGFWDLGSDSHARGVARRRIRAQDSCRIYNYQSVSLFGDLWFIHIDRSPDSETDTDSMKLYCQLVWVMHEQFSTLSYKPFASRSRCRTQSQSV